MNSNSWFYSWVGNINLYVYRVVIIFFQQGGTFFRRDKMYLPDVNFFVPKEPPAYTDKDMWIGNELVVNKHRFRLVSADEYALRYMELNAVQVSIGVVLELI